MLEFNERKLIRVLQREGWHDHEIEAMISLLDKVTDRLQKPFDEWLDHQAVSDEPLVEGLSIQTIMKLRKCHFLDALTIMDTYLDHPDLAKQYKNLFQSAEVNFHNALTIMNAFLYDPNLAETYRKNPYAFSGPMR